ncbi:hypothetical protein ACFQ0D_36050, partial [Micromonospora zhanjiangensis]
MRLVLRRARQARGLLLAAAVATLVATGLVTGLALYNRQAVAAGQRAFVSSAPPEERSLLVSGSSVPRGGPPQQGASLPATLTAVQAAWTALYSVPQE